MKKEEIKLLALKSFARGSLDPKKVNKFIKSMKRKELRMYIVNLRKIESQNKIVLEVSDIKSLNKELVGRIAQLFSGKKIEVRENPRLIAGVRVIDNDLIYDFNLENNLEEITQSL